MAYKAPVSEVEFWLNQVLGVDALALSERFAEASGDMRHAILSEGGRLCEEVLAPLQRAGDLEGARLENGVVRTSPGFAQGYRAIAEGGWIGIAAPSEFGGMGLPQTLSVAMNEMMSGACLALALNPLMSQGQIEALHHHASDEMKAVYLPKLIAGEWSGTMNLTEPQAGSDVGALSTKAAPNGDGSYSVSGQKIFISWGDSNFAANICHLVLARLPDAAAGTKGISLFLVPKFLPDSAGNPGVANSLKVVSLEHKLGIHGSPTAVMEFDGATGWLVGEENAGMKTMFTMMNNARLGVGAEGLGVAEAAFQQALTFAGERKQGRALIKDGTGSILDHADVRRMLMTMKAQTSAARAIIYATAIAGDLAVANGDAKMAARAAFLTPIAKAFGTETGNEVAYLGVQVHGGMGFIEETGAAQFSRDVRVTAIYEGTNGIQSMDLVARKLMDGGVAAKALLTDIRATADAGQDAYGDLSALLNEAAEAVGAATDWMLAQGDLNDRFAGSVAYLRAFALVLGGHFLLKAAMVAKDDPAQDRARAALARFFIRRQLGAVAGLCAEATEGQADLYALSPEQLAS
ncbi:MAG: acyl-CoA dehydrogenase [Alphaproteobacteria bacterium]|nr:acyl-CoA dehydrogenase [Alphaproteobacteria bacterium]